MHSYLRAIGFSEVNNRMDLQKLIDIITSDYTKNAISA